MNLIDLPMDAVVVKADHVVTTSLRVAEIFGKRHDLVLRAIRDVTEQVTEKFRLLNFAESSYLNAQGKSQPMIEMTRDGFTLVAMGFTGRAAIAFKQAYIERFNAMEQQLHIPRNFAVAIPPVLSLGDYLETRDSLHDLRAELDVLFKQLEQVDVRCKPAEIEAMADPHMQIGKRVVRVRDLVGTLDAHKVPRKVAEEITGASNNTIRQHASLARKHPPQE